MRAPHAGCVCGASWGGQRDTRRECEGARWCCSSARSLSPSCPTPCPAPSTVVATARDLKDCTKPPSSFLPNPVLVWTLSAPMTRPPLHSECPHANVKRNEVPAFNTSSQDFAWWLLGRMIPVEQPGRNTIMVGARYAQS